MVTYEHFISQVVKINNLSNFFLYNLPQVYVAKFWDRKRGRAVTSPGA